MWLLEISPCSTLYTTHPRISIRFPVGGNDTVTAPVQRPLIEAMAKRPFVRSGNEELYAHPVSLSKTSHSFPREIRQSLAPGLKSFLNRFSTLDRIRQVRGRHDDVVHMESPQVVPVLVADCFKRGVNHAKVLFHGHVLFLLPDGAWNPGVFRWITETWEYRRTAEGSTRRTGRLGRPKAFRTSIISVRS